MVIYVDGLNFLLTVDLRVFRVFYDSQTTLLMELMTVIFPLNS